MYYLTGITGLLLMLAPYIFNYSSNQAALWTSIGGGLIAIVASIWEAMETKKENWEYWVISVIGVFAIIAPFILNYSTEFNAMWSTIIIGALMFIMAGSKLWTRGSSGI